MLTPAKDQSHPSQYICKSSQVILMRSRGEKHYFWAPLNASPHGLAQLGSSLQAKHSSVQK